MMARARNAASLRLDSLRNRKLYSQYLYSNIDSNTNKVYDMRTPMGEAESKEPDDFFCMQLYMHSTDIYLNNALSFLLFYYDYVAASRKDPTFGMLDTFGMTNVEQTFGTTNV